MVERGQPILRRRGARSTGSTIPPSDARAIDLGCGEGRNAIWLALLGWSVTGVDMSASASTEVERWPRATTCGVDWIVADLEEWDLGVDAWDLIAFVYVHWPTDKRLPFMQPGHRRARARWASRRRGPRSHQHRTRAWRAAEPRRVDHAARIVVRCFGAAGLEVLEAREVRRPVSLEPGHGSVHGRRGHDRATQSITWSSPTGQNDAMTTRLGIAAMCRNMHEYLEWIEVVEACGYDLAGYGDTQNLLPDPYVALTAMAMRTSRVKLCTTVSNPMTRHPSVAASGFAALQELSNGRAIFGIGTGDSAVKNVGRRAARARRDRGLLPCVQGNGAR